jgi:hypothetical protein
MKNKKREFLILNGYGAETELDPRAQRVFGLLRPGQEADNGEVELTNAVDGAGAQRR